LISFSHPRLFFCKLVKVASGNTTDGGTTEMGEWRIQVSVRVSPALRAELEKYAAKERRSLGNFGAVILEWAFEQLKAAGSTERLLKYQLGKKEEKK